MNIAESICAAHFKQELFFSTYFSQIDTDTSMHKKIQE